MKESIKRAVGRAGSSRWLRSACVRQLRRSTNVVYYHWVGRPTPYYQSFYSGCTVERFRSDLQRLSEVFRFDSLEAVCAAHGAPIGDRERPSLSISFDDGFRINRPEMMALFDEFGIKATTFVNTRFVGNRDLMWRNKLSAVCDGTEPEVAVNAYNQVARRHGLAGIRRSQEILQCSRDWRMDQKDMLASEVWVAAGLPPLAEFLEEHQPYFSWSDLESWHAAGHGIGLHTHSHPFCSRLDSDGIRTEIVEPARELKARFGLDRLAFSYPFGDRLDRAREQKLLDDRTVDFIFGISGFASHSAPNSRLERAGVEEDGVSWPVFGQTLVSSGRRLFR